ncbi:MAG: trimeric intracellular cation channel family protein [Burkholderiaceae bacterium]
MTMTPVLLTILDLLGTFAFAISGAMLGVRKRLDLFGVLTLSFAAATAGGIARDVMIGATPPAAIAGWSYLATAIGAGLLTFVGHETVVKLRNPVQLFDAIGLALFAVAGTNKALSFGVGPAGACLLGVLSAIGGGIARDLLVAEVPSVLRRELYAVAALAGAVIVAVGHALDLPLGPTTLVGAACCFVLRFLAIRYGLNLPTAHIRG